MNAADTMPSLTVYIRATNADGQKTVRQHQVWDKERFIKAQQREAQKENDKRNANQPREADVQQITHEQYLKERG